MFVRAQWTQSGLKTGKCSGGGLRYENWIALRQEHRQPIARGNEGGTRGLLVTGFELCLLEL